MGVSRRSHAAQRGVSEAAARKAIAKRRITTLPDDTIDPVRADRDWGAQTDPAKQRGLGLRYGPAAASDRDDRIEKPYGSGQM
jgi:hypothetical protein